MYISFSFSIVSSIFSSSSSSLLFLRKKNQQHTSPEDQLKCIDRKIAHARMSKKGGGFGFSRIKCIAQKEKEFVRGCLIELFRMMEDFHIGILIRGI